MKQFTTYKRKWPHWDVVLPMLVIAVFAIIAIYLLLNRVSVPLHYRGIILAQASATSSSILYYEDGIFPLLQQNLYLRIEETYPLEPDSKFAKEFVSELYKTIERKRDTREVHLSIIGALRADVVLELTRACKNRGIRLHINNAEYLVDDKDYSNDTLFVYELAFACPDIFLERDAICEVNPNLSKVVLWPYSGVDHVIYYAGNPIWNRKIDNCYNVAVIAPMSIRDFSLPFFSDKYLLQKSINIVMLNSQIADTIILIDGLVDINKITVIADWK